MKYILLLTLLLLTSCSNKKQTESIYIDAPQEVIVEQKEDVLIENETESRKPEIKEVYQVNLKVDGKTQEIRNEVSDILKNNFGSLSFTTDEMPYTLPDLGLTNYTYDLKYYVNDEPLYNKTTIYEDYNAYDAVKVSYKDNYYYAYYLKDDLLFANVDERNRVKSRKTLDFDDYNPLILADTNIRIKNVNELAKYLEKKDYYDGDLVYFTDTLDIVINVKEKEEAKKTIDQNNDSLRYFAEKSIDDALTKAGFKDFVEFDGNTLVNFSFNEETFNSLDELQIGSPIMFDIPANWYRGDNYNINMSLFVNDKRTNDVEESLLKEAKKDLTEPGSTTCNLQISYELYRNDGRDKIKGRMNKTILIYRNK